MLASSAYALFALLAVLPTHAFFILTQNALLTSRLDPIVSPGTVSGHVHSVAGGSNFDKTVSYESARQSKCTTAPVSVDLSMYWTPQLYYYNPANQTYQAIPLGYFNAYYLPRSNGKGEKVHAFPDGLRMIAGDPFRRVDEGKGYTSMVCQDYYHNHQGDPNWDQRSTFFKQNCPNGMRAQVNFPSCWNGKDLDSPDHKSHMAYASGGPEGGGDCPSTHPVHLVTLFYEFVWNVQNFPFNDASQPTWVFANGDSTGLGMHGDFINGWPSLVNGTNILQEAIEQCNANNGVGGNLQDCPPFVPYLDRASASACKPENLLVDEDIGMGHPIARLPGDNPLWTGTGSKPSTPGYVEPETKYSDFKSVIPQGYEYVGCMAESTSGRALRGASIVANNMTRGACVSWCQDRGFPLAGMEYGKECYCDFRIQGTATNTTLLAEDKCGTSCANNLNENCGGANAISLYNNPAFYPANTLPKGWTAHGCMTEGSGGRALQGARIVSSSLTSASCIAECQTRGFKYAGAEYASECYCGNDFLAGSTLASDPSSCSMLCSGDNKEFCGGPNRLTTWSFSNVTATPAYLGCFAEGNPRTLNGTSYSDASGMTNEACVSFCAAKGYALAGMEATKVDQGTMPQECRCGSTLNQALAVDPARCSATKCNGNNGEQCGGDLALSVWTTANGTAVLTGSAPTKRDGPKRLSY